MRMYKNDNHELSYFKENVYEIQDHVGQEEAAGGERGRPEWSREEAW